MANLTPKSNNGGPMRCDKCNKTIKNGKRYWRKSGLFSGGDFCTKSFAEA